jgi:hypothetical protein
LLSSHNVSVANINFNIPYRSQIKPYQMASKGPAQFSYLHIAATAFATIFVGFGINAIVRPDNALSFFEMPMPLGATDKKLVNNLLAVYGVRDIFMGLAIYFAAFFGNRQTLGGILLAASAVAFADGAICYQNGAGEMNHWGYAPMVAIVGGLLLGTAS